MPRRLAMTTDGKLTWCTADDEHIGKGRCNHIGHQKPTESAEDFLERMNIIQEAAEDEEKAIPTTDEPKPLSIEELIKPDSEEFKLLKRLAESSDFNDRCKAIRRGYYTEDLARDENENVRIEMAIHGYCADILLESDDIYIRRTLASHGHEMEKLLHSDDFYTKQALVHQNYALGYFMTDGAARIREKVARQGYGLYELSKDDNAEVRFAAYCYIAGNDLWSEERESHGDFVHVPKERLLKDIGNGGDKRKIELISQNYGLEWFAQDPSPEVRIALVNRNYRLNEMALDPDPSVRRAVAKRGCMLSQLSMDPDANVRKEVANQGFYERNTLSSELIV